LLGRSRAGSAKAGAALRVRAQASAASGDAPLALATDAPPAVGPSPSLATVLKSKVLPLALACAAFAAMSFAAPATASTGPLATVANAAVINGADTAWILVSSALVLFMSIPGLALFYAGLVRSKNALSVLVHCFVLVATGTLTWTAIGYSLSFAPGTAFVGGLSKAFLNGVTQASVTNTIPELLWFIFQGTFYIITPGLMVGAFVERMKLTSFLLFTSLWSIFVYTPICHMVWGGGWLASMGVLDFAGGIVVHITAGVGALLTCIMLGPRKENKMTPHSLPMAVTGAGCVRAACAAAPSGSPPVQLPAHLHFLVLSFSLSLSPLLPLPSLGCCGLDGMASTAAQLLPRPRSRRPPSSSPRSPPPSPRWCGWRWTGRRTSPPAWA
jgi:hypothetical protein